MTWDDLAEIGWFLGVGSAVVVELVILIVVVFLDFSHLLFCLLLDRGGHLPSGEYLHQTVINLLVHHMSLPRGSSMSQESSSSKLTRGVRDRPSTLLWMTPGL